MDEALPPQAAEKISRATKPKRGFYLLVALGVALLLTVSAFYDQYRSTDSLKSKMNTLRATNSSLQHTKSTLSTQNTNLEKSVKSLQAQIASAKSTDQSAQDGSSTNAPKPTTSIVITGIKEQPWTDFAVAGYTPPQGSVRAVSLTIKNLSDSTQTYDILQFSAISDTGVVVKPSIYPPPMSTEWNNTQLTPGGTIQVAVLFDINDNLVTLQWAPDDGSPQVVVPLPSS